MPDDFPDRDRFTDPYQVGDVPPTGMDDRYWRKRMQHHIHTRMRRRQQYYSMQGFGAVVLIVLGVLLFLGSTGILPVRDVWDFWPLIFVLVGVNKLVNCRNAAGSIWAILLIAFGALFTLITTGVLHVPAHDGTWPLGLLLVALGFVALMKTAEQRSRPIKPVGFSDQARPDQPVTASEDSINESVVFSASKRIVDTPHFTGGAVHAVFGGVELDLRRCQIDPTHPNPVLAIDLVFASLEIRVPQTWKIDPQSSLVLTSIEDKSVPARAMDGLPTPTLTIMGNSVFSSIEIDN